MKTPCLNDLTHAELLCSHIEENGGGKADELMAVLLFETVAEVEQSVTVHLPWVRQVPGGSLAVRLSGHTRRFL